MATAEMEVEEISEVSADAAADSKKEKVKRIKLDVSTLGAVHASVDEAKANPVKNVAGEPVETHRPYLIKNKAGEAKGYVNAKSDVEALGLFLGTSNGYTAESTQPRGRAATAGKPSDQQIAFGKMLRSQGLPKSVIDGFMATIPSQFHNLFD